MTKLSKSDGETQGLKLFPLFTLFGLGVIMVAVIVSVANLSPTASSYWGGNTRSTRDAAEVGSTLLGYLTALQSIPKWLVPPAFLGVASFMTSIALKFAAIPSIIERRTVVLKQAVPLVASC